MYKCVESYNKCCENTIIIAGDFKAQLRPGMGAERMSVGQYTLSEPNKREDSVKHWLIIQNYVALDTMFRKKTRQASYVPSNEWRRQTIGLRSG